MLFHIVQKLKGTSDLEQTGSQEIKPFSHVLSHGAIRFLPTVGFKNDEPLIGCRKVHFKCKNFWLRC